MRAFLILFFISTFAQLRLYNAIVQNTRFAIKLREVMGKFLNNVPGLERAIRVLGASLTAEKATNDSLRKTLDKNTDATEELTKRIENIKFNSKRKK